MANREVRRSWSPVVAGKWFELSRAEEDSGDDGEALEALDRLLLRHQPSSDLETVVLLEVVAEALRGGGRIDGLDVSAVLNIRDRILRESRDVGLAASFAALQPKPFREAVGENRVA